MFNYRMGLNLDTISKQAMEIYEWQLTSSCISPLSHRKETQNVLCSYNKCNVTDNPCKPTKFKKPNILSFKSTHGSYEINVMSVEYTVCEHWLLRAFHLRHIFLSNLSSLHQKIVWNIFWTSYNYILEVLEEKPKENVWAFPWFCEVWL